MFPIQTPTLMLMLMLILMLILTLAVFKRCLLLNRSLGPA
jgi:hypothetical protein